MSSIRELCEKQKTSDSISERRELEEEINNICGNYLREVYDCARSLDIVLPIFESSDFCSTSGSIGYIRSNEKEIQIKYEDFWSYGGSCVETFNISFEKLENQNPDKIKRECLNFKKKHLLAKVQEAKRRLDKANKELSLFNRKVKIKTTIND